MLAFWFTYISRLDELGRTRFDRVLGSIETQDNFMLVQLVLVKLMLSSRSSTTASMKRKMHRQPQVSSHS